MPSRSRAHRGLSRALAVLLLTAGWGVPLAFPHWGDDDPVCVVDAGGSGASRIGAISPSSGQPEHCVVCHTARSFRSTSPSNGRLIVAIEPTHTLVTPVDFLRRGPSLVRLPARAPPA